MSLIRIPMLCLSVVCMLMGVRGFMFDDPCRLMPRNIPNSPTETVDVIIPTKCTNGTLDWNYPQGHLKVHFSNPIPGSFSACFKAALGGDVFDLHDVTGGGDVNIGHVKYDSETYLCTSVHHSDTILVRMDAPENLRYMGEVAFMLKH